MKMTQATSIIHGTITNMAKFVFPSEEWATRISEDFKIAEYSLPRVIAQAVYQGAKVLGDAGGAAAAAHGLGAGFGIATFRQNSDGAQTICGFRSSSDGYFTNRWGQTVPYDLAANVLEYGSSDGKHPATHFMTNAFKKARPAAEAAMRQKFQSEMDKLLKGE